MNSGLTYGQVDGFVTMLLAACDDASMNASLQGLLSLPDGQRRMVIHHFLEQFRTSGAPAALHQAFVCLLDDEVAERAYEMIHRCQQSG